MYEFQYMWRESIDYGMAALVRMMVQIMLWLRYKSSLTSTIRPLLNTRAP